MSITPDQALAVETCWIGTRKFVWDGDRLCEVGRFGCVNVGFAIDDLIMRLRPSWVRLASREGRLIIGDGQYTYEYNLPDASWQRLA